MKKSSKEGDANSKTFFGWITVLIIEIITGPIHEIGRVFIPIFTFGKVDVASLDNNQNDYSIHKNSTGKIILGVGLGQLISLVIIFLIFTLLWIVLF